MSAAVRTLLADAASTALGDAKRVTPYYRQSTTAGWGWVSLIRTDRDDSGFGFLDTWGVRICLSQEVAKAEAWIEANADALVAAVADHMVVTTFGPGVVNIDTKTTVNALIIEGVREH